MKFMLDKDRREIIRRSEFLTLINIYIWHFEAGYKPGMAFKASSISFLLDRLD